jgi:hypothetical protein
LRPLVFDRFACFFEVLEICSTEVLVLLDVEPEIQDILCTFALKKETKISLAFIRHQIGHAKGPWQSPEGVILDHRK